VYPTAPDDEYDQDDGQEGHHKTDDLRDVFEESLHIFER
jgi:hypothetical protein